MTDNITLEDWGNTWLKTRASDGIHRCEKDERQIWDKRIAKSALAKMRLIDITPYHVSQWMKLQVRTKSEKTGRPFARQTLANALNCLRVCLRDATEEGLIPSNPVREIRVPKLPRTTEPWTYLSTQEIDSLTRTMPQGDNRNAIITAIHTGLRSGELWGLRWSDIDFANNVIVVSRSFGGATKSGKVRRVPLLAPAREALLDQKARTGKRALVFPNSRGGMRQKGYNARLRTHLRRAGIHRRVRLHDLRHSCASHLVQGSWGRVWSLMEVRELLGHSAVTVTERYAHLCLGGIQRAAMETRFGE